MLILLLLNLASVRSCCKPSMTVTLPPVLSAVVNGVRCSESVVYQFVPVVLTMPKSNGRRDSFFLQCYILIWQLFWFLIFDHKCKWISLHLLLAGMHVAQPCRYCFYSVVQKWVFRPQGRHIAPIDVKFHVYRGKNVGIQPPKLAKFQFWPEICTSGATRLQYSYEILSICTRLQVA